MFFYAYFCHRNFKTKQMNLLKSFFGILSVVLIIAVLVVEVIHSEYINPLVILCLAAASSYSVFNLIKTK